MPRLSENRTAPYDGRFINANAATLALTGLSLEALKATTFQQFIVPEDLPDALARFYQAAQARAKSFGIKGMNERARAFNGTVRINGRPGEGTTVCIKFPMREPGRAAWPWLHPAIFNPFCLTPATPSNRGRWSSP